MDQRLQTTRLLWGQGYQIELDERSLIKLVKTEHISQAQPMPMKADFLRGGTSNLGHIRWHVSNQPLCNWMDWYFSRS